MNISEIKSAIIAGKYDKTFSVLYPDNLTVARERYVNACDKFYEFFGDNDNIRIFIGKQKACKLLL